VSNFDTLTFSDTLQNKSCQILTLLTCFDFILTCFWRYTTYRILIVFHTQISISIQKCQKLTLKHTIP